MESDLFFRITQTLASPLQQTSEAPPQKCVPGYLATLR